MMEYVMVKKNSYPPSSTENGEQVPLKCGDVSVYFTMEEWDYIEEHRDLYQKVVMESPQRSSTPPVEEPEVCTEDIKAIVVTEEEDGCQSTSEIEPVDESTNTYAGDFCTDAVSIGHVAEESYMMNSWETSVVHEATCTEEDLQEDSYTLSSSSSSNLAKQTATSFHGSQLEDSGENFPIVSPNHAVDNLAYTSTSEQCEEQAWTAYGRYVGDSSFTEHPQIKEETDQYNYIYDEEPAYVDPNPARVCEEQNQLFETMNSLLVHQLSHGPSSSVDKPYACSHCDKRFAKRSHLGMHLKTHTGEKPYACPDCGKRFSRRSNMATHYRTHTGEKPFACPKCGKRFTQSSHMVTHQRTHSSDKLFSCPECKKCFSKWSYLNFHLRTHGIEKLSVP
ncbi:hypothetical protein GDO81_003316 [Engystomops pustulosus]|uniref:C2H2-type domain-containing protein n=1 Tax=Engystomops pustulosus TaxID=76066 RepID=A0AAV6ZW35_ENGPU|nr:hypothetical protein GDO81_003316 [Engystomops pustulosus]